MDNDVDIPKHRKRNSGKIAATEEGIPFTTLYNPTVKPRHVTQESDKPTPNCHNNARCYFCDFCDNTSIHGFKFLGERQRYIIEKIWWFFVITTAVTGSSILIYNTYVKWVKAPVIVTFATTETPIWKIPFPAVTICPELKVRREVFNYSDVVYRIIHGENITEGEGKYLSFFQMVCDDFGIDWEEYSTFNVTEKWINSTELETYLFAFSTMTPQDCKWMGKKHDCEDLFTGTYTSEGECMTFNSLSLDEIYKDPEEYYQKKEKQHETKKWSLEEGYPSNSDLDTYPRRTILSGSKAGFEVGFHVIDDDIDYGCGDLQGYKVTLHHPGEEPDMDKHFRLPLDEAVFVGVKPRMITTADEIGAYKPHKRLCYLPGERTLETFKDYTQQNCMTECLTNYTYKACGCIGFYMAFSGDSEICNVNSKTCMANAKISFLQNDLNFVLNESTNGNNKEISEQCDCLPSCTSIEFEAETSQTKYDWEKSFKAIVTEEEYKEGMNGDHYSKLVVYYKDMQFITSERHQLYGTVDFLASCGGLLGLFCGFSFTSLMEILYYLTLRFLCNLKKFGKIVWSGAPELM